MYVVRVGDAMMEGTFRSLRTASVAAKRAGCFGWVPVYVERMDGNCVRRFDPINDDGE